MIKKPIHEELESRILVLDGGLGTMVQGYGLGEGDYRGEAFRDHPQPLKGCNDVLVVTAPDVIGQIHEAYLLAGADIISTDSFNATSISLADYGLEEHVYQINRSAAALARRVADKFSHDNPTKPRYVAGSMGPTSKSASMSADMNNPAAREVTFADLENTYYDQARGLLDGGAELLLIETIFDTLNAKAAIFAIERLRTERRVKIPLMISVTVADAGGRTLSGQTLEAFYASVTHADPLSIGFNCGFGARQLHPFMSRLSAISEYPTSAHPNAGLPNVMGGYDQSPQMMADQVEEFLKEGLLNIVGGCCGTTPSHIGAIAQRVRKYQPRKFPARSRKTVVSGLEPLTISPETNFVNVGERANVAGSAKFARLIRENRYEEAISVAREQVEGGAQIVDVCMDDGLIEGRQAMVKFLNLAMSEPELSRVPFMIDSSSWEVLEAGLQCVQGKSVVNSISLKEGPGEFLRRARLIHRYGAAAVVMLFDEKGQADTCARKCEVAQRAYDMLVGDGFPPEDIIFDPNVLAVATGIEQHDNYAVDFIEACRYIKEKLPYAKVSGGVSNLSFAFRGNNTVREAMHSVFLYHAIGAGMDMGIVNPAMLQVYSDIEPQLLKLTEDVILNRYTGASDELSKYAQGVSQSVAAGPKEQAWRSEPLAERMKYAMVKGVTDFIAEDTLKAYNDIGSPLEVIDRMLMPAMTYVGELFGQGKMFLPQVVKSARVMRVAVDVLTPYIEAQKGQRKAAAKVLMATVKGDVHDIGKNIVSVVMGCNGYEIVDLGVMVESERIVERAAQGDIDAVGLSGLITPSLEEMAKVVAGLEAAGLKMPVIIGGATTSDMHTAVKIAPHYSGVVVHSNDASDNITILSKLFSPGRDRYIAELKDSQRLLREKFGAEMERRKLAPLEEARRRGYQKSGAQIVQPKQLGRVVFRDYSIGEVLQYINWNYFLAAWGVKGRYPDILRTKKKGAQARELLDNAQKLLERMAQEKLLTLNGVVGIFPALREGDDIILLGEEGSSFRLPQLRNQGEGVEVNLSLADYVCSAERDYVGCFMVTAGIGLEKLAAGFREAGDEYNAIMSKLLADRLTEAFAESLHSFMRKVLWGFEKWNVSPHGVIAGRYQGLRMAFGYPAVPDHSLKKEVFRLLRAEEAAGVQLTENYMINPGESLCGLIFADKGMKYFSVGKISQEQLDDYAARRGMERDEIAKIIAQHL